MLQLYPEPRMACMQLIGVGELFDESIALMNLLSLIYQSKVIKDGEMIPVEDENILK